MTFFSADDLAPLIKQICRQEMETTSNVVFGHVASYDATTHRARWIIPSNADGDGGYVLTGWAPLGAAFASSGFGIQIAPKGGATFDNPTAGELCVLHFIDRANGVIAGGSMLFNQTIAVPDATLQPGEIMIKSEAGAQLKLDNQGNAALTTPKDLTAAVTGNLNATVQGTAAITSTGDCTITAPQTTIGASGGTAKPVMLSDSTPATSVKAV